jgi:adenylate kinase
MPTYIVLLGPPGVGKGTQAEILASKTGLPHISSGDLFRENMKNNTELGKRAKSYMDKGELVPDDVTIDMVRDRISREDCMNGAILDGFPRTPPQADALQAMLAEFHGGVDVVPFITASPEVLVERASGRWTCRGQGHIYHEKFNPPKVAGKCDFDGTELYQREDDKTDTVARRIRVYLEQTAPLVDYYKAEGKLVEIDGTQPIDEVTTALLSAIRSR